jgi:hypothetical protein
MIDTDRMIAALLPIPVGLRIGRSRRALDVKTPRARPDVSAIRRGEPMHGIELALLAFGAFALLYPKSPFTLAILRQRGPRRDHALLLRSEIRESARGFASYAIAVFAGAAAIHLAVGAATPRPDAESTPFYVALVTCAGVGTWLAWHAARAWLAAAFRSDAREEEILRARIARTQNVTADAPLGAQIGPRGILIPGAPAAEPADVEQLLGARVAVLLLALGAAAVLAGAAVIGWTFTQRDASRGIAEPATVCAIGVALVALALRLNRVGPRGSRL